MRSKVRALPIKKNHPLKRDESMGSENKVNSVSKKN